MNLKSLTIVFIVACANYAHGQLTAVMADTNGRIVRPANVQGLGLQNIDMVTFANLTTYVDGNGSVVVTNSFANASVPATNSSAVSSVRLMSQVVANGPAGAGTLWNNRHFIAWVKLDAVPRENGIARITIGHNSLSSSNVALSLTNRGVGVEIRGAAGFTNEVRLIAHNGTNSVSSAWQPLGSLFGQYTIGIESDNGTVKLHTAAFPGTPQVAATLTNGPTANGGGNQSAFDVGIIANNTNEASIGVSVYSAWIQTIP